uniref:Uncharacterized protein n=1 Tax=Solanum lycopersicum TaxID=4081 RepID=A0A3Q7GVQ7_SOLLC
MKRSKSKVISSSSLKNWSFNDPEMQRKKRVVGYKAYGVEDIKINFQNIGSIGVYIGYKN